MNRYHIMIDGEGIAIPKKKEKGSNSWARMKFACCDCGLVHDLVIVNGRNDFGFCVKRNKRATAQRRKNKMFKKESK